MAMPKLPKGSTPQPARADEATLAGMMANATVPGPDVAPPMVAKPAKLFFLYHHPANWQLSVTHGKGKPIGKPTLLPEVRKFLISPGVFGCRTHDKHEDPSKVYLGAVGKWRAKGYIFLDPDETIPQHMLPPGVPEGGYLRELRVQHPQVKATVTRWSEAWDIPVPTLPGEPQRFQFHRETYELWLAWLVQSGTVPTATPEVLARFQRIHRKRVDRVRVMAIDPTVRGELQARRQRWVDHLNGVVPIEKQAKVSEVAA